MDYQSGQMTVEQAQYVNHQNQQQYDSMEVIHIRTGTRIRIRIRAKVGEVTRIIRAIRTWLEEQPE